jgi:hypothetical protein
LKAKEIFFFLQKRVLPMTNKIIAQRSLIRWTHVSSGYLCPISSDSFDFFVTRVLYLFDRALKSPGSVFRSVTTLQLVCVCSVIAGISIFRLFTTRQKVFYKVM